jgi:DNA-binding HxlR family transcriptional regulator
MELFDLIGQRWTLRIVWALRTEPLSYRQLAAAVPGLSTGVLTHRLRCLRKAALIRHSGGTGYELTGRGNDLLTHLQSLRNWAYKTEFTTGPADDG